MLLTVFIPAHALSRNYRYISQDGLILAGLAVHAIPASESQMFDGGGVFFFFKDKVLSVH